MRSGTHAALHIAVCLLVLAGPGLAAQTAPTDGASDATGTTITIEVRPGGDARVTVSTAFALNGSNETSAFADLAEDFERGDGRAGYSIAPFERAAAAASEATGRQMTVTDVRYEASVENGTTPGNATGRLALSFEWQNFSVVDGDTVRLGDAFETPNGTWLPGLTADQRLVVEVPEGYTLLDADAPIEDGALVWRGPTDFDDDDLDVVLERGQTTTTPTPGPNGTDASGPNGTDPPGEDPEGLTAPLFGSVALVVGTVALGAYALSSRDDDLPSPAATADLDGGGGDSGTAPGANGPAAVGAGAVEEADGAVAPPPDDGIDEELLSDEERVERLLRSNGGRMRQADIVIETGWSNAKVSQLLSAMDEEDRVDKLRIGRENLISLPGVETGIGVNDE
ncbi:helix-turn-helix transcriptional regulator [Halomarina litorea]|uniref:helix-turn-helix transcriptional regulator n=1 Tax=Halomarina litorea TaxID=2961595 RepID=UPI0020C4B998|nr:hypothetical protein [Halomarina sp. BCD28]